VSWGTPFGVERDPSIAPSQVRVIAFSYHGLLPYGRLVCGRNIPTTKTYGIGICSVEELGSFAGPVPHVAESKRTACGMARIFALAKELVRTPNRTIIRAAEVRRFAYSRSFVLANSDQKHLNYEPATYLGTLLVGSQPSLCLLLGFMDLVFAHFAFEFVKRSFAGGIS
jgi:hypothetical protein